MLERGRRLDEAVPGDGFGLPITLELAELYGGGLALGAPNSEACGRACVCRDRAERARGRRPAPPQPDASETVPSAESVTPSLPMSAPP